MFSREFFEISNHNFSFRTPPVAAAVIDIHYCNFVMLIQISFFLFCMYLLFPTLFRQKVKSDSCIHTYYIKDEPEDVDNY